MSFWWWHLTENSLAQPAADCFSTDCGPIVRSNNRLNKHFSSECLWFDWRASFKCLSWIAGADYLLRVYFGQNNPLIVSLTPLTIALYEHVSTQSRVSHDVKGQYEWSSCSRRLMSDERANTHTHTRSPTPYVVDLEPVERCKLVNK